VARWLSGGASSRVGLLTWNRASIAGEGPRKLIEATMDSIKVRDLSRENTVIFE
jgi:hypothetical protein